MLCYLTHTLTHTRRYNSNPTFSIQNFSNNHGDGCRWMHDERAYVTTPAAEDGAGERCRSAHLAAAWIAGAGYNTERAHRTVQTNRDRATNIDL